MRERFETTVYISSVRGFLTLRLEDVRLHAVHDLRLDDPLGDLPARGHHALDDDGAAEDNVQVGIGQQVQQALGPLRALFREIETWYSFVIQN